MIFFDDSTVKINGVILPGIFKSMEVKTAALIEEVEVKGKTQKPKQATGYEDAKVNIELTIEDSDEQTKLDKLDIIHKLFKNSGQSKPNVYEIVNEHTATRGISRVIFKDLTTKETNKKSEIIAVLEFWEYIPVTVTTTKVSTKTSNKTSKATTVKRDSTTIRSEKSKQGSAYMDYLTTRGAAPKLDKATNKPISNIAPTIAFVNKIKTLQF